MISLKVPIPPSANQIWRRGRGRFYLHPKYQSWLKTFGQEWMAAKPRGFKALNSYRLIIQVGKMRKGRDIDNLIKPINDALQKFHIIENDNNCTSVSVAKWSPSTEGNLTVMVEEA